MTNPDEHAVLGASSAARWMHCPGSIRLAAELPEPDDHGSVYAREGTAAHAVAAKCLLNGMDPELYVDQKIEGIRVTGDMAAAIRIYVDKVRLVAQGALHEITDENVECRFDLSPLEPPEPMFGTVDYWQYDELRGKHLWIFDYKHGQGVAVEAEENEQLLFYALGAVLHNRIKPRKITVVIVQPRCAHPMGTVRDWTFNWEHLVAFKERLMVQAYLTREPDAPLAVGDWCKFCPAKAHCPAQYSTAVTVAQSEFADLSETDPLPQPHVMLEEELEAVLDKADMVLDWLHSVQAYAREQLEANKVVEGWKLVAKRANRKWVDEEEVLDFLKTCEGMESDDYTEPPTLLSPAKLERALKRFGFRLPAGLTHRTPSGYNMVREDDPRPAASPQLSAVDEFTTDA
jgi:hypothetical protein